MNRVLVIETAFPGDAILAIALADELKRLDAANDITYLVRPDVKELLTFAPSIDRVISYDKRGDESGLGGIQRKAAELNQLGFDIVYVLHHSARTGRLLALLDSPLKIGSQDAPTSFKLQQRIATTSQSKSGKAISLATAIYDGVSLETLPTLLIPNGCGRQLSNKRVDVVLAPGSVWQTKCWPVTKYRELAKTLVSKGHTIAIIGGNDDKERGRKICQGLSESQVFDLTGKTSLVDAAAIIGRSSGIVTNDSAPAHLATAVRTKSIVLFGPTLPSFGFAPPPALGNIIEVKNLWCRPCTTHGSEECPVHTHACMEQIEVSAVESAVLDLLKQRIQ
jgi:heptosyltransferase-2